MDVSPAFVLQRDVFKGLPGKTKMIPAPTPNKMRRVSRTIIIRLEKLKQ